MSKKIVKLWLIIIIILAASLRFIGIKPGFPPYHSDEGISYSAAVSMIKNGNIDPLRYDYPAVVPLVNAAVFKSVFIPLYWLKFYVTHLDQIIAGLIKLPLSEESSTKIFQLKILGERERNALFWGRYVTALFGIGVVWLTFLVAAKLYNQKVALFAAALVAINFRQVLNSHFGLPDIYNAFFLLLSFLTTLNLWLKPSRRNYLLAAILAGISFSTKYQVFALLPLLTVHLDLTLRCPTWKKKIIYFFRPEILVIPLIIGFTFVLINPYHLLKLPTTLKQVHDVSLKYGVGQMSFYLYPYSYLYHIGIGIVTSYLVLIGFILGVGESMKKTLVILSVIIPFFFVTTYYSTGGFYTRNFVTVIPFLLIFAGFALSKLLVFKKNKLNLLIFLIVLILATRENLINSVVVAQEYTKPWNYAILFSWIEKNIPNDSKIAAHSSVPLPDYVVTRLPYEFEEDFSMDEFAERGADYVITNLDWTTNQFYGWMKQAGAPLQYWDKPVDNLEQTYPALAVRELSQHSLYWVLNPWQAPDSDFIVAKIPKYKVSNQKETLSFNFRNNNMGWSTKGSLNKDIKLSVTEDGLSVGGEAVGEDIIRWESTPIKLDNISGFLIKSSIIAQSEDDSKNAYLTVNFYGNEKDAANSLNKIAVRMSKRLQGSGEHQLGLIGIVPQNSNYLTISFRNYNAARSEVSLASLQFYSADIKVDYGDVRVDPVNLDTNILFPNSHGNL